MYTISYILKLLIFIHLKENKVDYEKEDQGDLQQGGRVVCKVPEQKETPDGLIDDICGRIVLNGHSGLCR